jgi:hypothetical protein
MIDRCIKARKVRLEGGVVLMGADTVYCYIQRGQQAGYIVSLRHLASTYYVYALSRSTPLYSSIESKQNGLCALT